MKIRLSGQFKSRPPQDSTLPTSELLLLEHSSSLPVPSLESDLGQLVVSPLSFSADQRTMAKPSWCHLNLLELYPSTSDEVESTIVALKTTYPWIQTPQINLPDGPWPAAKPYYVHKSHIMTEDENYRIAVDNIARTGRILDDEEDKYLQYLLCYPSGWSATSPLHHDDSLGTLHPISFPSYQQSPTDPG